MTEQDPGPIVQRIMLGIELTAARDAIGMTQADAARALGWSPGKLSKVEHGDAKVSVADLETAVEVFRVGPEQAGKLAELARDARRKLPPSRVREWAAKYVNLERVATGLDMFYLDQFPGAVQVEDYARAALNESVSIEPIQVERMVADRVRRSERLGSFKDRRVRLIVGEEAVLRVVGGPEVMRAQLRLVQEIAQLSHVTVQVLPLAGGAHAAPGVSFTLVTLLDGRARLVYREGLTGAEYLVREHTVVYARAFDRLAAAALTPGETMALIDRRLT